MTGITPEEMYLVIPEKCQKCKYNAIQRLMYCEDCVKKTKVNDTKERL